MKCSTNGTNGSEQRPLSMALGSLPRQNFLYIFILSCRGEENPNSIESTFLLWAGYTVTYEWGFFQFKENDTIFSIGIVWRRMTIITNKCACSTWKNKIWWNYISYVCVDNPFLPYSSIIDAWVHRNRKDGAAMNKSTLQSIIASVRTRPLCHTESFRASITDAGGIDKQHRLKPVTVERLFRPGTDFDLWTSLFKMLVDTCHACIHAYSSINRQTIDYGTNLYDRKKKDRITVTFHYLSNLKSISYCHSDTVI